MLSFFKKTYSFTVKDMYIFYDMDMIVTTFFLFYSREL